MNVFLEYSSALLEWLQCAGPTSCVPGRWRKSQLNCLPAIRAAIRRVGRVSLYTGRCTAVCTLYSALQFTVHNSVETTVHSSVEFTLLCYPPNPARCVLARR